jgi:hypothetical protein
VRGARSSHPTFSSSEMKKDGAQQPPEFSSSEFFFPFLSPLPKTKKRMARSSHQTFSSSEFLFRIFFLPLSSLFFFSS